MDANKSVIEMANYMGYEFKETNKHFWECILTKPNVGEVYRGSRLGCFLWLESQEETEDH